MNDVNSIFFITPDPVLGIGLHTEFDNFHVVCMENPSLAQLMRLNGQNVFCLEEHVDVSLWPKTSRHLLRCPETLNYIQAHTQGETTNLLFFKLNFDLENFMQNLDHNLNYRVLNVPFELSRQFEDKLKFARWLPPLFSLPFEIMSLQEVEYDKLNSSLSANLVLQFPSGHAGENTFFVSSSSALASLKQKYSSPELMVKITPQINGLTVTVNGCVTRDAILSSFPFIQLTGIPALTPYQGGTCGNIFDETMVPSWAVDRVQEITQMLGSKLRETGFWGWFGLDFILSSEKHQVYVVECNPRLTASISMFTQLQTRAQKTSLLKCHVQTLSGGLVPCSASQDQRAILRGSQIVVRSIQKGGVESSRLSKIGRYLKNQMQGREITLQSLTDDSSYLCLSKISPSIIKFGRERLRLQCLAPHLFVSGDLSTTNLLDEILNELK